MVAKDWDIKLKQGSTTNRFRLLKQGGRKAWRVSEEPPNPRVEVEAASREGFHPDRELPFVMEDWVWGTGLERFGSQSLERGHTFRYADGFNIDTSQAGVIRHGPLIETIGSVSSGQTIEEFTLFLDKVYIRTTNKLYNIVSGTLTEQHDFGAAVTKSMAVFADKLYIAVDTANTYFEWDGTTMTSKTVTDGSSLFLATQGASNPILIRVINDNFISTSSDPNDVTSWDTPGVKVGEGDTINSLFVVSGFPFAGTESTVYVIATDSDGVSVPIELDKRLATRRSSTAFSIKAESGSDVWLSDGRDIMRLVAEGFELFDIRQDGPFRSFDTRPVTSDIKGTPKSIAQDLDAVYVLADRSGDIYVHKGVELSRGQFAWSPWAKYTGTNAAAAVLKTTGDADPFLYAGNTLAVVRFKTENWTTFAATWELHTPQFTATLETWDKMWQALHAFLILTGTAKVEVSYKLNNDSSWTDFNDATSGTNDMTADGINSLKLAAPINGKKVQLRFLGSNVTNTHKVDMRSFNLEGLLRPDRKPIFDFTVVADTAGETTFLNGLRTDVTQFITITDRFGTDRTAFILPGFPVEEELTDEARREPVRTYRIVAQEVI